MRADFEKRLQAVEEAVRRLQQQLEDMQGNADPRRAWWREQAGRFKDDPAFEEILRLGKKYRESLRPKKRSVKRRPSRAPRA